jgi:hypothetical protein
MREVFVAPNPPSGKGLMLPGMFNPEKWQETCIPFKKGSICLYAMG